MGSAPSVPETYEEKRQLGVSARRDAIQQLRAAVQRSVAEEQYVLVEKQDFRSVPPKHQPSRHVERQTSVSVAAVEDWQKQLLEDPKNRLALAALSNGPATDILSSRAAYIADSQIFNVRIPHEGSPVTNQRSSGRCWLFASTNTFRVALMKRYKMDSFQLSQAYLFFWDKLEKANYFLETVLDTADEPLDGRLLQALLASPVGDGGQWDMVANLVAKYGIVPHDLYPDSFNAKNSSAMDRLITTKLREDALRLRKMASSSSATSSSIQETKEKMLQEVHLILTIMLGPPPNPNKNFTWRYYDRTGAYRSMTLTPHGLAAQLRDSTALKACSGTDVTRLFSLVNDPRNEYLSLLTVSNLGNVYGGRAVTYVNVDMKTIKAAAVAMLRRGLPVFFGCDVGKASDSRRGVMDAQLYDYELGFNVQLGLSKAERLRTGESQMTHAMVLTAVHVEPDAKKNGEETTVRWRVENSWSEDAGDKGYFVMSDEWMDEYTYQVVVDPAFVSDEVRKVLKKEPKRLDLWDPMGALA